jgi:hypothetical protein
MVFKKVTPAQVLGECIFTEQVVRAVSVRKEATLEAV